MDMELAEMIIEAMENNGMDAELRSDYSGRGMYGKSTHGIVIEDGIGNVMAAIINNADIFVDEDGDPIFSGFIELIRSDSMGLSNILY